MGIGMVVITVILALIAVGYLLAIKGRRGARGLTDLDGWLYAHRGFHQEPDAPENSLAAFRLAVEHGYGAELDVHLLSDGNLAVLHDSRLKRMTGQDGVVEALREDQLADYRLGKSSEGIPTLSQVLQVVDGRVPLIIELKPYEGNDERLCERVFEELDHYQGLFCVECFYPQPLYWLKQHRPDIIRGQLSMNYFKEKKDLTLTCSIIGTGLLTNFLAAPDFIAYKFVHRRQLSNQLCLRLWKLRGAAWTIHTKEELAQARREGCWPIFENFDPETGRRFDDAVDT